MESPDALREVWFQPMGLCLRVLSNHPAILAAAEASFRGFGPPLLSSIPDITLRLRAHHVARGQRREPQFEARGHLAMQSMSPADFLVANRSRGVAWGRFSPAVLAQPGLFRSAFLEFGFLVMLQQRGLMAVHASACVKHGKALLLRAPSGGGKTTLAYAAARSRFQALAEDVVWIDWAHQVWWGMPWWFRLLPDARHLFPELAGYSPTLELHGKCKLEVNLDSLHPGSTTAAARPGPVVLLQRRSGGRCRLAPLRLPEAQTLWHQSHTGTEADFPDYQRHVEALLADNAYRLDLGDDIDSALDLIEPLLSR